MVPCRLDALFAAPSWVYSSDGNSLCCYGLSSTPSGFLVVFEKPNRSSFAFTPLQAADGGMDPCTRGPPQVPPARPGAAPLPPHRRGGHPLCHGDGPHGARTLRFGCAELKYTARRTCCGSGSQTQAAGTRRALSVAPLVHFCSRSHAGQVQQLLHAISLTAVDRTNWRTTQWYLEKYRDAAAACPKPEWSQA